ncbi:COG4223 family protein [Rhodoplanes sp. Z2-YC6860]|uniref:COG4223 family protein n=1 Tax=Rhodoplanes sp. Z2-YC6860 TaxID=674703 RepID=UPI00078D4D66|nr:hypothetical protein [Rhodoplanes sp. Z2-YC6860]AMN38635.1 hypothetical protein RHPLAN_01700 [Rhodoplanes sp. Z2-YC6860]
MSSTKRPPSDPPGGRRRPPPVINLEATEVSVSSSESPPKTNDHPNPDNPAPQQQAADLSGLSEAKPDAAPPEQVAFEPPSAEAAVESRPQEPQQPAAGESPAAPPPPNDPPRQWSLPIVAGLSGLGGGLVLFVLLWLSGALSIGQLTSSPPQAASPDLDPRLGAIEQQLKELSARPAATAADPRVLNDVAVRLGKLESAISVPRAPDPVVQSRVAAAESTAKSASENVANLTRRLDALEAASRESGSQIQQLAAATAELQAKLRDTGAGADRPVRLAVAASALRAAVERGEPYATELAIVKPLTSDIPYINSLERFAASGLPSQATLGQELITIIRPMMTPPAEAPRDSTFLEKLQANAERLVRVRPIGEVHGDDPGALLARIEQRARDGNIAGAQAELRKLPMPPDISRQTPLQTWIDKADARARAVEAARKLAADAVTALKAAP